MQPTVICLMGPTASGKTAISLQLAKELNAEIVSVDSAMVYRGLDIGTAKPVNELLQVPHHLIDICDPSKIYSVAQFLDDASKAIARILANGKIPLLVGGTMLYFKALQRGLAPLPRANSELRNQLNLEAQQIGWEQMHAKLAKVAPQTARLIKSTDSQRIQRALEVYQLTGLSLSELWREAHKTLPYHFINVALWPEERGLLHDRIALRFQEMIKAGFYEEVKKLYDRGDLHADLPAIRSVGYRQMWEYLKGNYTQQEMEERAVAATRQLAKRQLTWLRRFTPLTCFNITDVTLYKNLLEHIIRNYSVQC